MRSRARAVFSLRSHLALTLLFPLILVICIIEFRERNSKLHTLNLAKKRVSNFWFYMTRLGICISVSSRFGL